MAGSLKLCETTLFGFDYKYCKSHHEGVNGGGGQRRRGWTEDKI